MLISKAHRKIVLNPSKPNKILALIPSAKTFEFQGKQLMAVRYGVDEVRLLENLGLKVPSPIEHLYPWSGNYSPFAIQRHTASMMVQNKRLYCLNGLGTGKTLSTLWAYDFLRREGLVSRLLVVAPLSTLERTWADELFQHFPHLNYQILHGSREKRIKLLAQTADIYIINHDGIKTIRDELCKRPDLDMIVIDELASFRNSKTTRWKDMNRILQGRERVVGLTGTPTPNEPTDAYAQVKLLTPARVPPYAGSFRDLCMKQISAFKWLPRPDANNVVARAMQPAVRYSLEDATDLPPVLYQTRNVPLSAEQHAAYQTMLKHLYVEMQTGAIKAINEAVKISKLVQICCGAAYTTDGSTSILGAAGRIQELLDLREQANSKMIVFVPYKHALGYVHEELSKHYACAMVSGETSKHERDVIFRDFQKSKNPDILVAQPACMAHGLTLTAASVVAWYAPVMNNEIYLQANGRIRRPGQKHTQLIVNIEGSAVERKLYARLKDKQTMQGLLLDILKNK